MILTFLLQYVLFVTEELISILVLSRNPVNKALWLLQQLLFLCSLSGSPFHDIGLLKTWGQFSCAKSHLLDLSVCSLLYHEAGSYTPLILYRLKGRSKVLVYSYFLLEITRGDPVSITALSSVGAVVIYVSA